MVQEDWDWGPLQPATGLWSNWSGPVLAVLPYAPCARARAYGLVRNAMEMESRKLKQDGRERRENTDRQIRPQTSTTASKRHRFGRVPHPTIRRSAPRFGSEETFVRCPTHMNEAQGPHTAHHALPNHRSRRRAICLVHCTVSERNPGFNDVVA